MPRTRTFGVKWLLKHPLRVCIVVEVVLILLLISTWLEQSFHSDSALLGAEAFLLIFSIGFILFPKSKNAFWDWIKVVVSFFMLLGPALIPSLARA
jgi:hypothetical protein